MKPVDAYEIGPDCTRKEFLAVARVYARDVVAEHALSVSVSDLDWEVSHRAKRRAGAVKYRDGDPVSVVLTWAQFANNGWEAAAETIRHELIHVHLLNEHDDPSHGDAFERLASRLETRVNCDRFVEPAWWIVCAGCDRRIARYRRSKLVRQPDAYRCRHCGGDLTAVPNE